MIINKGDKGKEKTNRSNVEAICSDSLTTFNEYNTMHDSPSTHNILSIIFACETEIDNR